LLALRSRRNEISSYPLRISISRGGWKRWSVIGTRSVLKSGKPYHVLCVTRSMASGSSWIGRVPRSSMPPTVM
jgi:hypothetical protein